MKNLFMKGRIALLLLAALLLFPAAAASAQTAEPPVVRAVLFTSPICTICRQIVEHDLPPAIRGFGSQLEILYVDVNTDEGGRLYRAAFEAFGVPRGVPLLFIGEETVGGINLPTQLPALVEAYLESGGLDWPAIPGLEAYLADNPATPAPTQAASETPPGPGSGLPVPGPGGLAPVVHAVLFWMDGCPGCHIVLDEVLPPLEEQYGPQLEVLLIEMVTMDDVDRLYAVAAAYSLSRQQTGVPLLIVGDRALVGSVQIPAELPGLIDHYLAQGGVGLPSGEVLAGAGSSSPASSPIRPDGFTLAVIVLVLAIAALLYKAASLFWGRLQVPAVRRLEILLPVLALVGLGVAVYLAYVETRAVEAFCGPVGDCNAVQSSPYAKLFGVLPVGVLGLLGYIGILAAWWAARRQWGRLSAYAPVVLLGMVLFGVAFSVYLTYLEIFVIRAVCLWCLGSAVIMVILLFLCPLPTDLGRGPTARK